MLYEVITQQTKIAGFWQCPGKLLRLTDIKGRPQVNHIPLGQCQGIIHNSPGITPLIKPVPVLGFPRGKPDILHSGSVQNLAGDFGPVADRGVFAGAGGSADRDRDRDGAQPAFVA